MRVRVKLWSGQGMWMWDEWIWDVNTYSTVKLGGENTLTSTHLWWGCQAGARWWPTRCRSPSPHCGENVTYSGGRTKTHAHIELNQWRKCYIQWGEDENTCTHWIESVEKMLHTVGGGRKHMHTLNWISGENVTYSGGRTKTHAHIELNQFL